MDKLNQIKFRDWQKTSFVPLSKDDRSILENVTKKIAYQNGYEVEGKEELCPECWVKPCTRAAFMPVCRRNGG